ncbi:hypothetical protein L1999_20315 [Neobacillus drentensis]|uniref:hypothetical protein n=1 Tax=Neobacillus drentensis TaxID=220684 RepID=UPI001F211326|nr:hypothetical protein [Neobacillus drentensis]ULT55429.1 hypothetical protein L1999_20315 [Neobacillus drentensis]
MLTDAQWKVAEQNGIPRQYVRNRLQKGWSEERAITDPVRPYKGLYKKYYHKCREIGLSREGFNKRLRMGMTPEQAATEPKRGA